MGLLSQFPAGLSRDRLINAAALAGFVGLLIIVGAHHEPWFDEAQAWLIARDNSLWSLLTQAVRYEGTPGLWHGLLWVLQRLGLPYGGFWLVSSALATAGAWVVLYRAPFPAWMRVGLIFSYFFAYQFSVVARSYALDLLLLPLAAMLFHERQAKPIRYATVLGLLANANAHSFLLAGVLGVEMLWTLRDRLLRRDRPAAAAILICGLLGAVAAFQAWPPHDINFITHKAGDYPIGRAFVILTEGFVERWDVLSAHEPSALSRMIGVLLTAAILAPAILLWRAAGKLYLALALFGVLLMFSIVQYASFWHSGLIFLTFVFCLWIGWDGLAAMTASARQALFAALTILLAVQVVSAAAAGVRDVRQV